MGLWSALISNALSAAKSEKEENYVLSEADKEEIKESILDAIDAYELTEEDKAEIKKSVLDYIGDIGLTEAQKDEIVNEVIGKLPTGGTAQADVLEYINSVSTTEDVKILSCDKDKNGNNFELKKVVYMLRVRPSSLTTTNSSVYALATFFPDEELTLNSKKYCPLTNAITVNAATYDTCAVIVAGIEDRTDDNGRIALMQGIPSSNTKMIQNIPAGIKGLCRVGVLAFQDKAYLGPGTILDIYGVRV